jgi:hypothetical protein
MNRPSKKTETPPAKGGLTIELLSKPDETFHRITY